MPSKYRYGVILDAGSSGTRVHIYRWLKPAIARAIATKEQLHQLPTVKTKNKKWTMKVHPGISTFGDDAHKVGPKHLKELLDFATDVVPKSEVESTPFFMLATAGMRLLPPEVRGSLMAEVCDYVMTKTKFYLPNCDEHIQTISGATEGLYGWIAANYLIGGFNDPEKHRQGKTDHHTYGFLDMGGASAQIAFVPSADETKKHADDLKLLRMRTIDGNPTEYRVFTATFLQYGANEARRRYIESITRETQLPNMQNTVADPCLPQGLSMPASGDIVKPGEDPARNDTILLGTGEFAECLHSTLPLLDKGAACPDQPCLFHGVHVPALDFDINHFIGVSNFWHGTHEIFNMGYVDQVYDLATYQERVIAFCESGWEDIQRKVGGHEWGEKVDEESAGEACFKASWIINLLHEGIGIPRVGLEKEKTTEKPKKGKGGKKPKVDEGTKEVLEVAKQEGFLTPFTAVNKIDDTEVAWVLGKMVLYAASQIPPADEEMLDVGFGYNDPKLQRLPEDFQHGGSDPDIPDPDFSLSDYGIEIDDDEDLVLKPGGGVNDAAASSAGSGSWRDSISLSAGQAGRTPGYILFALIIVVVGILLCGRERRANLLRRTLRPFGLSPKSSDAYKPSSSTFGKARRKLPFGLFGSWEATKYDRLMEEGDVTLHNPSDFELGGMSSQSSSANHSSDDDTGSMSSKSSGRRKNDGRVTPRRVLYAEDKEQGRGSSSSRQSSPQRRRRDGSSLKESAD